MPLLRLHLGTGLPGEYPEICILCGKPAPSTIERTLSVSRSLEGTTSCTLRVPACEVCAARCSKESLYKWLTILGSILSILGGIYCFAIEWAMAGLILVVSPFIGMMAFSLYSSRCNVKCQEIKGQYALIKLKDSRFIEAYHAHRGLGGEEEQPLDLIERMLVEGSNRAKILEALTRRGQSSQQATELLNGFLAGRRSANRKIGFKRIGYGGLLFAGGLAATLAAPNTIFIGALVVGFAYFTAGVVQLLTGTGDRLG
ncbi:MAG: hypothetical protein U0931_39600 [Vulcanimicrobiota bacterium]